MNDLRLCIGPGQHAPPADWISVEAIHRDTQPLATIVLKDGESLTEALGRTYPDGFTVAAIFCGHMWEHVHQNEMLALAREYFGLLSPGGQMGVIQPDFRIAMQYFKDGLVSMEDAMRHGDVGDTWDRARWTEWYRSGELDHWAMHKCNSVPERFVGLFTAVGFEVDEREPTYDGMAGLADYGQWRRPVRDDLHETRMTDPMQIGNEPHPLADRFIADLAEVTGPNVVEFGTRRWDPEFVSHHKAWVPHSRTFTMLDIEDGEDVDMTVDIHDAEWTEWYDNTDAVIAVATWEHLARPAIAMQRVADALTRGGLFYMQSHQSFMLHGTYGGDFYRFSREALETLATDAGLDVIGTSYTYPVRLIPQVQMTRWNDSPDVEAYLCVDMLARKP